MITLGKKRKNGPSRDVKDKKIFFFQSSHCGAAETNLIGNHEVVGSIPVLTQWVKDPAMNCGVGCRYGLDPTWLCL